MKLALALSCLVASASAFAPVANTRSSSVETTSLAASLNGWTPDSSKFCYGLPGSLAPVGEFDPLGLSAGAPLDKIKRFREAEVQHVSSVTEVVGVVLVV